jgi:hypothetical protein
MKPCLLLAIVILVLVVVACWNRRWRWTTMAAAYANIHALYLLLLPPRYSLLFDGPRMRV